MQRFSDEESAILDTVRKIALNEIPKFESEENFGTVPRGLFSIFGQQGLTGLTTGEAYGGFGKGTSLMAAALEEIAAVNLGPAIFLSVHLMVSKLIERYGSTDQKKKFLPRLASGEHLGAFALTEPAAGSDASNIKTEAKRVGDNFILNGEKCYITSAGWAEIYIVFARTDPKSTGGDGVSTFIVEKNTPGFHIGKPERKMGCELSPIASLSFSNSAVPAAALLGDLHKGYKAALAGLAGGRISIAACANGLSRSAIERTISHLKERQQFGQPLAEFQGLQFMLADMQMKFAAAALLTKEAALEIDSGVASPTPNLNPSMAKCFATDAAMSITTDAVQLFGGAGYIKEYVVERLMRDAKMLQIVEGTNQIQRTLIAKSLLKS